MLRRFFAGLIGWIVKFGTLGCLVVSILAFGGSWHWYLDQFSHLRPQYLVASGLALTFFILAGKPRWSLVAGIAAALNMAVLVPHAAPLAIEDSSVPDGPGNLNIATVNLFARNTDFTSIEKLLRERQPDVVAFQEVSLPWQQAMTKWKDIYPHQTFGGKSGSYFHLGILSKRPWKQQGRLMTGNLSNGLWIDFDWNGKTISLLDIHGLHPTNAAHVVRITAQHDAAIKWVQEKSTAGHQVVVLGDFNLSPWSSHFQRLTSLASLQDTSRGRPFSATRHALLYDRLMIDHILLRGSWILKSREIGPEFGSDHRPVFATIIP